MSDIIEIRFPEDQQEGTEATLAKWLKGPGDAVDAHEPLAEIETDKVMVEVAAPAKGAIAELRVKEGDALNPGELLCTFSAAGTVGSESTLTPARLSPAVRQRVMEYGIDPADIEGTGRGGRVTLKDVEAYLDGREEAEEPAPAPEKPAAKVPPRAQPDGAALEAGGSLKVPHDAMRRRIASHMVESLLHTAPHVTAVFEADLSAVLRHRAAHKAEFARRGRPLTLTAYFIAASVAAIRKVPQANSRWHDEHLEIFGDINIGIGTALGDKGLIVPVLKQANDKGLAEIAAELTDLTMRAREGELKPEDVRGGTFTISNHGVSGSLLAAPIIINQPQSAILGIGKIEKRVKVREVDGEDVMMIRPMCYVSLTIDHRVLDGYQTNAFLTEFCRTLEEWV